MTDRPTDPALEAARECEQTIANKLGFDEDYIRQGWVQGVIARALTAYRRDTLLEAAGRMDAKAGPPTAEDDGDFREGFRAGMRSAATSLRAVAGGEPGERAGGES